MDVMRPLIDLHCHLEGTLQPPLLRTLAARNAVPVPDDLIGPDDLYRWHGFGGFLDAYDRVASAIRTARDYRDVTFDHFARAAALGQIYGEVFVSPDHAALAGLNYVDLIDGVSQGLKDAEAIHGICGRIITTCVRHLGPERALEIARMTIANPHPMVVGFGMGGDERYGDMSDYAPAYDLARSAGLGLTVHAGEVCGPESVEAALDHLRPDRIGHGVQAVGAPDLLIRLAREEVTLEVCPGSNLALGLFTSYDTHAFGALHTAGCRLALGADDPPFFQTDIGREYAETSRAWGLNSAALDNLTHEALTAGFCDEATKTRLRRRIADALD
jgi:adenosine deaminase